MEGRSVYKDLTNRDGEPYKAWIQIDFENKDKHNNHEMKQFHENYGFDIREAVSKFSIPDLNDDEKSKALIQSLQKGNIQSVSIEKEGSLQKMFIEANPQYKTINLYDGQMKRVMKEGLEQYQSNKQSFQNEVGKEDISDVKKKDIKTDITANNKPKNSLLPKKQANGLLQKKRTSNKKGLSV